MPTEDETLGTATAETAGRSHGAFGDPSLPTPPVPRSFDGPFGREFLDGYQRGTLAYTYRG